jgi:hypothetical protein
MLNNIFPIFLRRNGFAISRILEVFTTSMVECNGKLTWLILMMHVFPFLDPQ